MTEFIRFLQDPANAWILYLGSVFLVFDGVLMHAFRKKVVARASGRGVATGGDNNGVVVSGRIDGDLRQTRWPRQSGGGGDASHRLPDIRRVDRILASAANLSTIAGFALAAWTFYNA
jgi:hypothetical protein